MCISSISPSTNAFPYIAKKAIRRPKVLYPNNFFSISHFKFGLANSKPVSHRKLSANIIKEEESYKEGEDIHGSLP